MLGYLPFLWDWSGTIHISGPQAFWIANANTLDVFAAAGARVLDSLQAPGRVRDREVGWGRIKEG